MERYEAILEQLKKAQGRGMETISNRLDFVVQSLEELIQEARSSVQGALPQSADEYFPMEDVEAALKAFREEAETQRQRADALEDKIAELETAGGGAAEELPIALMRALDGARSQSELLRELLPVLSEHTARAVVLVVRDGSVSAWSGIGFTDGELLRGWQGKLAESPALVAMLESSAPISFAPSRDELFQRWLTEEAQPTEILLIPVVLRGKLMGAIYADRLDGQPWHPSSAQTLVALVCLLIDTLSIRGARAAMLADPVDLVPTSHQDVQRPAIEPTVEDPSATVRIDKTEPAVMAPPPPAEDEPVTAPEGESFEPTTPIEPDFEVAELEVETPQPIFEPTEPAFEPEVPETEFEPSEPDLEPEAPDTGAGFEAKIELETEPKTEFEAIDAAAAEIPSEAPPKSPPAVEPPAPPPAAEEAPAKKTTGFLDEPPPVKPVQPPPVEPEDEVSEDEAQREEARRFARLLVSEIKLYNEEQVERGREAKDLYHRLKEDIDRSREMFNKRISSEVRSRRDYFQDELVKILADGDPDALGT